MEINSKDGPLAKKQVQEVLMRLLRGEHATFYVKPGQLAEAEAIFARLSPKLRAQITVKESA